MNIRFKQISIIVLFLMMGYLAGNMFSVNMLKSFVAKAKGNTYDTNKYRSRNEVHKLLKTNSNDFVFLGNSITENFEWYEYFNDLRFKNRGIGSDVIQGAIHRLENINQSEKLFSLIGINDIITDSDSENIISDYRELIDHIISENKTKKLYVVSILPVRGKLSKFNDKILQTNLSLEKLCQEKQVPYINAHKRFVDQAGELKAEFSVDGVHLTGEGYQTMCDVLSAFIKE